MLRPAARQLLDYWRSLPMKGHVPSRSDFDPARIPEALPLVALVERRATDVWLIRLVGTEVVRRIGMEVTGRNFIDFVAPVARPQSVQIVNCVCDWPCASLATRDTIMESGRAVRVDSFVLPLRAPDGEVRLAISINGEVERSGHPIPGDPITRIAGYSAHDFLDIGAGVPERNALGQPSGAAPLPDGAA